MKVLPGKQNGRLALSLGMTAMMVSYVIARGTRRSMPTSFWVSPLSKAPSQI